MVEKTSNTITLTRREQYMVFQEFEEEKDVYTKPEELEDVTDLIFGTLKTLKGTQMLCKPELDLYDTMSCFEVMDPKMDNRMHRRGVKTAKQA